ncbi:hypothetical protein GCM10010254_06370 [Streptomyces chromofuscus]|nr:hypothetical protein GCM10010254_06370 [Streptomyces chromofuscus]
MHVHLPGIVLAEKRPCSVRVIPASTTEFEGALGVDGGRIEGAFASQLPCGKPLLGRSAGRRRAARGVSPGYLVVARGSARGAFEGSQAAPPPLCGAFFVAAW